MDIAGSTKAFMAVLKMSSKGEKQMCKLLP